MPLWGHSLIATVGQDASSKLIEIPQEVDSRLVVTPRN